jgi:Family of unknown function (DUF6130)
MRSLRLLSALLVLMLYSSGLVAAAGPDLTVIDPKDGASIERGTVTITFTATGIKLVPTTVPVAEAGKHPEANKPGEGHLHFVLDLQPLVVWERNEPYTFSNIPPGEHQLMVELVNNDHSSLSPPVMRQIRFGTKMPTTLPTTGQGPALFSGGGAALLILVALMLAISGAIVRRRQV